MFKLVEYEELDSTNSEAKRLIAAATRRSRLYSIASLYGTVVIASRQTAGRGRMGRTFVSPGAGSIYISFILPPPERPAEQLITALAGVAVCEALENETAYKPEIKWVNDILVNGKKVCGILAESVPGAVALGIGININIIEDCLPEDIRDKAGSLQMDAEERARFKKALIESVFRCTAAEGDEAASLMNIYREHSALLGKSVILSRGAEERPATATEIADDGALIVKYEDGSLEALRTSEVSVRL